MTISGRADIVRWSGSQHKEREFAHSAQAGRDLRLCRARCVEADEDHQNHGFLQRVFDELPDHEGRQLPGRQRQADIFGD